MREPITTITSRGVALSADDVDTDQIIPARFLTTTTRTGLGDCLFHDWRHRVDGSLDPDFALNRADAAGARILIAGRNFGCGSSREHAVWALLGAGFRAVISQSFADIFRANAIGNGLLPVQVPPTVAHDLLARGGESPLTVDLPNQTLSRDGVVLATFAIDPFGKHRLMHGIDEMEFLLRAQDAIAAYETRATVSA